jgi:hypothetical protein
MEIIADFSQVEALEARLLRVPGGLAKAMERALNRAGYRMVTVTSVGVRARYTTKAAAIKERLWVTKASARAGVFESRVDPKREGLRRLSLVNFAGVRLPSSGKARPKQGIRVRVLKGGGGYLPHSFVAPQRNISTGEPAGPAIFQRATKGGPRTPIVKMKGPSVASQMKNTGVRERLIPEGQKILDYRLAHECRHVLREAGLLP